MQVDPDIAFLAAPERPAIDVRVNFGLLAGREVTAAEIDELALLLRPDFRDVTIVSETRHEIGRDVEAAVHQVRIEVEAAGLPAGEDARDRLAELVVATATFWARMCAAERHTDV